MTISIGLGIIEHGWNRHMGSMTSADSAEFFKQAGRFAPISVDLREALCAEAQRAETRWIEEYGEYQSGGWSTVSLFNYSGDPKDVRIKDCVALPTTLLETMPRTREFIEGLGLRMMWARLARLTANSFLWEHVDYGDLNEVARQRLHIPLATNSSARLVTGGRSLNLGLGHIWRLAPAHPHGVCNFYGPDRIHIVIDCYENEALGRLLADTQIFGEEPLLLPLASDSALAEEFRGAQQLLDLGFTGSAERHLLRLFFNYRMPTGTTYDLIVKLYLSRGMEEAAMVWKARKKALLGAEG